jgi:hypothetical protein
MKDKTQETVTKQWRKIRRASLGGLRHRLQQQLRSEPYQTGVSRSAPAPEPLKSRSLEPNDGGGATKTCLRVARRGSSISLTPLPSSVARTEAVSRAPPPCGVQPELTIGEKQGREAVAAARGRDFQRCNGGS